MLKVLNKYTTVWSTFLPVNLSSYIQILLSKGYLRFHSHPPTPPPCSLPHSAESASMALFPLTQRSSVSLLLFPLSFSYRLGDKINAISQCTCAIRVNSLTQRHSIKNSSISLGRSPHGKVCPPPGTKNGTYHGHHSSASPAVSQERFPFAEKKKFHSFFFNKLSTNSVTRPHVYRCKFDTFKLDFRSCSFNS